MSHDHRGRDAEEARAPDDALAESAVAEEDATPSDAAGVEVEVELTELERALELRDQYLEELRRVAAEFDNYKKRMAREADDRARRASERIVGSLLNVHDDLERAVGALKAHPDGIPEPLVEGIAIVHRSLADVLTREGVSEIDPVGDPFDPHNHEALLAQPSDEPEGTVIQVVQKGFRTGDRVLRPARVIVAAGKD